MGRYYPRQRLLFVHIPRTGGTWAAEALDSTGMRKGRWKDNDPFWVCKGHRLFLQSRRFVRVSYFATFVRHPLAYYESVWKWLTANGGINAFVRRWRWHPHLAAARLLKLGMGFDDWVAAILASEPCWYTRLLENYVGPPGGETCDFIGRTEYLA